MRLSSSALYIALCTGAAIAILPSQPITVTVTTTINQCLIGTASASPPSVPGNPDRTGTSALSDTTYASATLSVGSTISRAEMSLSSGVVGQSGTSYVQGGLPTQTMSTAQTGSGAVLGSGATTFSSTGRPDVPHAPESSSASGTPQQTGSGAGSISATGYMSESGSVSAISSGSSTTSSFSTPASSSSILTPSSAPPMTATSSATITPSEFPITLELKSGVQVKVTDGSIGPKASALAAGGTVKGPKTIELDAIKDQNKDIKFELYTQRFEGSFIAKCRIYSSGAMTRSANFILKPEAVTSLTDGSIRLDCTGDDFAPGPPFWITLDVGESIDVKFTAPKMFSGKTFNQGQVVFGGLQAPDRRSVDFDVVVTHGNGWRYDHKCTIQLTSDDTPDGYTSFTLQKKPYGQARRAKAWFDYKQQNLLYVEMVCTATNPDW